MIYLDHAATTPLHPAAKTAMAEAMEVVGNPSSLHGAGSCAKALLEESRKAIADCLGCEPTEILFTSGGTESNALALHGKNRVLTSPMEHPSLVKNCRQPLFFPVKDTGIVDDCDLEGFLPARPSRHNEKDDPRFRRGASVPSPRPDPLPVRQIRKRAR